MSRSSWVYDVPLRGFYRDRENAWIFGVCAGIAERFNFRLGAGRLIAIGCLFLFSWLTIALYFGATLLIRQRPLIYSGSYAEHEFWRRRRSDYWRHP